ncbi:DinB family protein [Streptomyces sp. NPDC006733]|uniref:DinB family protein n=1 Tax=Streptomyces sp. NPDC006733 TaxID=3155460 RepID=UPI0033ED9B2B
MTWTAPEVPRNEPPMVSAERASLESWLAYHRATLLTKCAGLTAEQLALRPVTSSTLSLLGLVRHMAEVERWWFRILFDGQKDLDDLYCPDEDPDGDFDRAAAATAEADFAVFASECELADRAAAGRSLDETFPHPRRGEPIDLRWVYVHMIEEYARHNGHADLLRELTDGVTGE